MSIVVWFFCQSVWATDFLKQLSEPIATRTELFKQERKGSYPFLAQIALNKKVNLKTRWRAITTMGRLDQNYFRATIDKALLSREWFMRNSALIALQSGDRARAVEWSTKLLNDPALVVRTQAVRNIIQLNARETEPLLWKQVFAASNYRGKESLWVRIHIAEALAKFAPPGRAKMFLRLLTDSDERLHKWALLGLENTTGLKIGDKELPVEIRREEWLARMGVQEI